MTPQQFFPNSFQWAPSNCTDCLFLFSGSCSQNPCSPPTSSTGCQPTLVSLKQFHTLNSPLASSGLGSKHPIKASLPSIPLAPGLSKLPASRPHPLLCPAGIIPSLEIPASSSHPLRLIFLATSRQPKSFHPDPKTSVVAKPRTQLAQTRAAAVNTAKNPLAWGASLVTAMILSNPLIEQTILTLPLGPHPAEVPGTSPSGILEAPHSPGLCKGTELLATWCQGTELEAWSQNTGDQILPLSNASCETLCKLQTLSVPQSLHLYSRNNKYLPHKVIERIKWLSVCKMQRTVPGTEQVLSKS